MITPLVVIRPIFAAPSSVNQMFPSGPAAIPQGMADFVGTENSVIWQLVVTFAIRLPTASVTHRLLSDPVVIPTGRLPAESGYVVTPPPDVTLPTTLVPYPTNQMLPSGPAVIPSGFVPAASAILREH